MTPNQTIETQSPSLPPSTTVQQDITTAGQRRINLIWERTQATIALFVVFSTLFVGAVLALKDISAQIPTIFSVAFGTVVGFYFSRTNHAAIGGIGSKSELTQKYEGR